MALPRGPEPKTWKRNTATENSTSWSPTIRWPSLFHQKPDGAFEEVGLESQVAADSEGRTYAGMGGDFAITITTPGRTGCKSLCPVKSRLCVSQRSNIFCGIPSVATYSTASRQVINSDKRRLRPWPWHAPGYSQVRLCLLLRPVPSDVEEGPANGCGLLARECFIVDDRTTNEGARVTFTGFGRFFDSIIRSSMPPARSPINLLF